VPRETLERELYAVHQRYGTTEYAFAIQELPSLAARHPGEDLVARYARAIDEYRTVRRRTLRLYPDVAATLVAIKAAGCLTVGYTESRAYYANYRIRALGLDGLLDYVYSAPDHALPIGMTPEQIRKYPAEHYRLTRTVQRHTPEGVWKPEAAALLGILGELGARPDQAIYAGDSLVKDVVMARAAGVVDVFARYGLVMDHPGYELLRKLTHWSPAMVAESEKTTAVDLVPSHVLERGFSELLHRFEFGAFTPGPFSSGG
jgi:phosphoglycolate phosphatase